MLCVGFVHNMQLGNSCYQLILGLHLRHKRARTLRGGQLELEPIETTVFLPFKMPQFCVVFVFQSKPREGKGLLYRVPKVIANS